MDPRRLKAELRQFQVQELDIQESIINGVTQSDHRQSIIENIEFLSDSRSAVAASQELLGYLLFGHSEPTTVSQAVDDVMKTNSATRFAEIIARVSEYYPELSASVRNLENTVFAALNYGIKSGKYRRPKRGLYQKVSRRNREKGGKENKPLN